MKDQEGGKETVVDATWTSSLYALSPESLSHMIQGAPTPPYINSASKESRGSALQDPSGGASLKGAGVEGL